MSQTIIGVPVLYGLRGFLVLSGLLSGLMIFVNFFFLWFFWYYSIVALGSGLLVGAAVSNYQVKKQLSNLEKNGEHKPLPSKLTYSKLLKIAVAVTLTVVFIWIIFSLIPADFWFHGPSIVVSGSTALFIAMTNFGTPTTKYIMIKQWQKKKQKRNLEHWRHFFCRKTFRCPYANAVALQFCIMCNSHLI
jgi:hypothetical protein